MLTVLLQGPDENVRALLDAQPYLDLVTAAGCHAFLIEEGRITELTDGETPNARETRAC